MYKFSVKTLNENVMYCLILLKFTQYFLVNMELIERVTVDGVGRKKDVSCALLSILNCIVFYLYAWVKYYKNIHNFIKNTRPIILLKHVSASDQISTS